ncbi:MAG TPA: hypothetical protein VFC19_11200 [Candidatus Limnocylindrales bacterium]|nr:hypothetical protein [Candidatus Limnocylindrales bacterium]
MRRIKAGLAALAVCGLALSNPVAAQADPGASTPSGVAQLKAETVTGKPIAQDGTAPLPARSTVDTQPAEDECAKLKALPPDPNRKGTLACVTDAPPPSPLPSLTPDGFGTQAILPLPPFCFEHAFDGWWYTRTQACAITSKIVIVLDAETLLPIGDMLFLEFSFSYTSGGISTWAQQIDIRPFLAHGAGALPGTMVSGTASCRLSCIARISNFPPQPVTTALGSSATGEAFFDTTAVIPGMVGDAFTKWTYRFTNPGWLLPTTPGTAEPPKVRCDNAVPGYSQIGCIFSDYTPVMQYSRDGLYPELARHIGDAQASGLPGAYPNGAPLVRMVDEAQQTANRNAACPRAYPRPITKSCDEYPFASTRQGAAQPPLGPGRTFSYCSITPLPQGVTAPTGYSACMIDAWQNSTGGSALNTFFQENRVIDNDEYRVWITGTGGGPNPLPPDFPPTADAGPDVFVDEGSSVLLNGSATDDRGTPMVTWTYEPVANVDPGALCSFRPDNHQAQASFFCTDDGTFRVTLIADDGIQEFPVSDSALVTVNNVAPCGHRFCPFLTVNEDPGITTPAPWQVFRVGDTVNLSTTFTDPGSNDTHVCGVSWDDGNRDTFVANGLTCGGSHVYPRAGMYTIKHGITDDDGGEAPELSVLVIVYDPDAGFATAGGHLPNPGGGTGHFQFNPKYLPHDEGPEPSGGKVNFRVQSGPGGQEFDLDSTGLEWLVVTQDDKIAAKGTASVNGVSGYGFVVYGYDARTDRFRLVVWSLSDGPFPTTNLVYDNRTGADFDLDLADPAPIGAGSIQVHH